jgi:hypothetical protein
LGPRRRTTGHLPPRERGCSRAERRGLRPRRAEQLEGRGAAAPRGGRLPGRGVTPLRRRAKEMGPRGHPIAPTKRPGGPSAAEPVRPFGLRGLRHGTPRRGMLGGPSRPEAGTGRGLPPNLSCERWPTASDPQPTTAPAATSGVSAVDRPRPPKEGGFTTLSYQSGTDRSRQIGHPNLRRTCANRIMLSAAAYEGGPRCGGGAGPRWGAPTLHVTVQSDRRSRDGVARPRFLSKPPGRAHPAAPILGQAEESAIPSGTLPFFVTFQLCQGGRSVAGRT